MDEKKQEEIKKEEFSNENLSLTVEKKADCLIEYIVKVGPTLAKESYRSAIKKIAKEVTIPGFRKGKAPEDLIRKKYASSLDQKWQKELADITFKQCQSLVKIPVLSSEAPINFHMKSHSQESAEMTFSFETEPEVPPIDLEKFELKRPKKTEINDQKVDDTLKQIRLFYAKWQKITDRPVQEGDFVILDATITEEEPPKPLFNNTRFEVNEKTMAKWMHELVIGQTIGKALEGFSRPDEEATDEEKENLKPKKVLLVIKGIEEPEMPPLDDAFAQKIGAKDVVELKNKLKDLLQKQAEEDVQRILRDTLSKRLLQICHFDLPKSLINKETTYRFRSLIQNQSFLLDWKNKSDDERRQEQKKIEEEAKQAVRLFYIAKKIVADANLKVTHEDLHPQISTPLEAMFADPSLVRFDQKTEEEKALTLSRVMLSKAEAHLLEQLEKQHLIKE